MPNAYSLDFARLAAAYAEGVLTPCTVVRDVYHAIEADHANPVWIQFPIGCTRPDHADGSLSIQQRAMVVALRQPILQHHPGNAVGVQPTGNAVAFTIHHPSAIAAARADHHRGAIRRPGVGQMHRDGDRRLFGLSLAQRSLRRPDG